MPQRRSSNHPSRTGSQNRATPTRHEHQPGRNSSSSASSTANTSSASATAAEPPQSLTLSRSQSSRNPHRKRNRDRSTDSSSQTRLNSHRVPSSQGSSSPRGESSYRATSNVGGSFVQSTSTANVGQTGGADPVQQPVTVREIPGFYYDAEKKKYFKILPNHALGSQHPHSRQSIHEKTVEKPVLEPIQKPLAQHSTMSTMLSSPWNRYTHLDRLVRLREIGMVGNARRQLCDMHTLFLQTWRRQKRIETEFLESNTGYMHIQTDPIRPHVYLGWSQGSIWKYDYSQRTSPGNIRSLWQLDDVSLGELTSLHVTSNGYALSTYSGHVGQSGTIKLQLLNLDASSTHLSSSTNTNVLLYSPKKSDVWTSAFSFSNDKGRPLSESSKLAFGASHKFYIFQNLSTLASSSSSSSSLNSTMSHVWTGSDVFSLEFEPKGGNELIYVGCRNGSVMVYDLKRPEIYNTSPTSRQELRAPWTMQTPSILHGIGHKGSTVQCIRRISDYYLVTGAMNGEIALWDTRFVGRRGHGWQGLDETRKGNDGQSMRGSRSGLGSGRGSGSGSGSGSSCFSTPMLELRGPVFEFDLQARKQFDINREETLLASANMGEKVSVWSLRRGERVLDLDMFSAATSSSSSSAAEDGNSVDNSGRRRNSRAMDLDRGSTGTCVRFSEDMDRPGLWATTEGRVLFWGTK